MAPASPAEHAKSADSDELPDTPTRRCAGRTLRSRHAARAGARPLRPAGTERRRAQHGDTRLGGSFVAARGKRAAGRTAGTRVDRDSRPHRTRRHGIRIAPTHRLGQRQSVARPRSDRIRHRDRLGDGAAFAAARASGTTMVVVLAGQDAKPALIASADRNGRLLTIKAMTPLSLGADRSLQLWALPRRQSALARARAGVRRRADRATGAPQAPSCRTFLRSRSASSPAAVRRPACRPGPYSTAGRSSACIDRQETISARVRRRGSIGRRTCWSIAPKIDRPDTSCMSMRTRSPKRRNGVDGLPSAASPPSAARRCTNNRATPRDRAPGTVLFLVRYRARADDAARLKLARLARRARPRSENRTSCRRPRSGARKARH